MPMGKMLIPLLMLIAASIGSGCHCTICGSAEPTRMAVLEASRLPQEQGWAVETNAAPPFDITIEGNALTFNTIGVPRMHDQDPGKAFLWLYREIPIDVSSGFSIEWKLKVHATEQPHNLFDAGIMFYGSIDISSGTFAEGPRRQMIFFDEDAIGWGDETDTFAMDTTDTFHTFTLTVDGKGRAKVYVDGTPALQRSDWVGIPRIGFGDMTNDDGVNGKFSLEEIIVTGKPS